MTTPHKSPPASGSLGELVARLVHAIDHELDPGELAELRRAKPDDCGGRAFWKLVLRQLVPAGALPEGGSEDVERRWSALLSVMARLGGQHRRGQRLGRAMAAAGVSEQRLLRLLRAHDDALAIQLRLVSHQLGTAAQPVDFTELARLLLSDGRADEEATRRGVARAYYDHDSTA